MPQYVFNSKVEFDFLLLEFDFLIQVKLKSIMDLDSKHTTPVFLVCMP